MIMPMSNLMENPSKTHKYSKSFDHNKAKGMSCFAFLLSIVIYISIFYIFSLSPSTVFTYSKFWFAISNTLILIIAADYGAFASSKDRKVLDLYDEYALHGQARRTSTSNTTTAVPSSFVSQYPVVLEKTSAPKEEESLKDQNNNETPARIYDDDEVIKPKTIRRSKSDKVTSHGNEPNLQRSNTEKHATIGKEESVAEDENEFSSMSDEELNRRVEEFIEKFNRQIRLQGVRNRQLLEDQSEIIL